MGVNNFEIPTWSLGVDEKTTLKRNLKMIIQRISKERLIEFQNNSPQKVPNKTKKPFNEKR